MTETTEIKKQMQEKINIVNSIKEKISKSSAFYVAQYKGVNVEDITKLRRDLRANESEMQVLKNKMLKLAIKDESFATDFEELLKGQNAIAFSLGDDAAKTAKVLFDFAKTNKNLEIKGCLFENEFYGPDKISIIKDLPSREQLLATIARLLNEPMAKLARTLDALKEKQEGQAE